MGKNKSIIGWSLAYTNVHLVISLGRCNTHVLCNLLIEGLQMTHGGKTREKSVAKENPMLKEDADDKENQPDVGEKADVGEKEKDKEQSKMDKKVQEVARSQP